MLYHTMLLPRSKVWRLTVFVLVTTFLVVVSAAASTTTSSSLCRVLDGTGQDVTVQRVAVVVDDSTSTSSRTVVQCHEAFGCANYTISHCDSVECFEPHACDSATLLEITSSVSCHATQACRRATILFETSTTTTTTVDSNSRTATTTMDCIGEDACNVAQIHGGLLQSSLHCQGRKACRKVNAVVDQVVCAGGTHSYPACTGFASLETRTIQCLNEEQDSDKNDGTTTTYGCSPYINQCRTKSIGQDVWQQCPIEKKDEDGS